MLTTSAIAQEACSKSTAESRNKLKQFAENVLKFLES